MWSYSSYCQSNVYTWWLKSASYIVQHHSYSKWYSCWRFFSSHLYAWLHWNPTQDKEKRLPHAPNNNTVTHLPFMELTSSLVVLQPSCTYKTLPVSVYFAWFRASRLIKHLQHNQQPRVQNGGEELCCGSRQILIKPLCYVFATERTTLPVTMTTNRNFPSYTSPKCFSAQIPSSPLLPANPPKFLPAALFRASPGVGGIHFDWFSCRQAERDQSHD